MASELPRLSAVIGVWNRGTLTYHVKRSQQMQNYPGVWSLFSMQHATKDLSDPLDLRVAQRLMERMAGERLGGVVVRVTEHLAYESSDKNPIGRDVHLNLYRVELTEDPTLNPAFYEDGRWMTFEEYEDAARDTRCGLCMRMWGDFAFLHGIIDHPFVPGGG